MGNKKFRILSLDGGGLKGIIQITVLKEIERRTGKRITDLFDLIAGTSTGGLIACALTVSDNGVDPKYTLKDIEDIYTIRSQEIFPIKAGLGKWVSKFSSLKNPKFKADGLQNILEEFMGDKRLNDCIKPLFITSLDLYNNETLLFKTRHALIDPLKNALLIDVCRSTSAAPTYLPAYDFMYADKRRLCVDGGLYMNNPSLGAVIEFSRHGTEKPYNFSNVSLEDVVLLSLGTGHHSGEIARQQVEGWGILDWAPEITSVMMQAMNQVTTYEVDELLSQEHYFRVNVTLQDPKHSGIADSSEVTREYWISQVQAQILNNKILMMQMDDFFSITL